MRYRLARTAALAGLLVGSAFADKKVISPDTTASNDQVDIAASITLAEPEVAQKIGMDPGPGLVVLQVRVTPKADTPIAISPDDFILLAHDDGERTKPFTPEEMAGQGAMVVTDTHKAGSKGSALSGLGGMMMGGGSQGSPGNSKPVNLKTKMDEKKQGNDALLKSLQAKQLPTAETVNPVQGLLYFPLTGKHKLKNLIVLYRGTAGKLDLEFQH